ncbi:MAG: hypothetical protein LBT50_03460 [Prevotellaceae bacterium]|nr:hypothetical protein [Prevotellaceae bacterium]
MTERIAADTYRRVGHRHSGRFLYGRGAADRQTRLREGFHRHLPQQRRSRNCRTRPARQGKI